MIGIGVKFPIIFIILTSIELMILAFILFKKKYRPSIKEKLQILILTIIIIILSGPYVRKFTNNKSIIYLIDVSNSCKTAMPFLPQTTMVHKGDEIFVIGFAKKPKIIWGPDTGKEFLNKYSELAETENSINLNKTQTNIEEGIAFALSLQTKYHKHLYLITDGKHTAGNLFNTESSLLKSEVPLTLTLLNSDNKEDTSISGLKTPIYSSNSKFILNTTINAPSESRININVIGYENAPPTPRVLIDKTAPIPTSGILTYSQVISEFNDLNLFKLVISPLNEEFRIDEPGNNEEMFYVNSPLSSKKNKLIGIVSSNLDSQIPIILNKINNSQIFITDKIYNALNCDVVIFDDYIITDADKSRIPNLKSKLESGECGLVVFGGQNSMPTGGYKAIENLLPVNPYPNDTLSVIFLIDSSASMGDLLEKGINSESKFNKAFSAFNKAKEILSPNDNLEIITFNTTPRKITSMRPLKEINNNTFQQMLNIAPSGGTKLAKALLFGIEELKLSKASKKLMIAITDSETEEDIRQFEQLKKELDLNNINLLVFNTCKDLAEKYRKKISLLLQENNKLFNIFTEEQLTSTLRQSLLERKEMTGIASGLLKNTGGLYSNLSLDIQHLIYNRTSSKNTGATEIALPNGEPLITRGAIGLGKTIAFMFNPDDLDDRLKYDNIIRAGIKSVFPNELKREATVFIKKIENSLLITAKTKNKILHGNNYKIGVRKESQSDITIIGTGAFGNDDAITYSPPDEGLYFFYIYGPQHNTLEKIGYYFTPLREIRVDPEVNNRFQHFLNNIYSSSSEQNNIDEIENKHHVYNFSLSLILGCICILLFLLEGFAKK